MTAILAAMHAKHEDRLFNLYADVSGRQRAQGMGIPRDVIIADSDSEAIALWKDSGVFSGRAWFAPFGFRKGVMDSDTVARNLEAIRKRLPVDWIFYYSYKSLVPIPF